MIDPADEHIRDVALLMTVRLMPEEDFQRWCASVLRGEPITIQEALNTGTPWHSMAHGGTPWHNLCPCCGGPVGDDAISDLCASATGVRACKVCIDDALCAIHGPHPHQNPLVRTVLRQAVEDHA